MSDPTRIALCVALAVIAWPDPLRPFGRSAEAWARREIERRASDRERRAVAALEGAPAATSRELFAAAVEPSRVLVVVGTVRVTVRGGKWEPARERTPDPIIIATPQPDDHWLFATSEGQIFRSDSFDGPLVSVGSVPCTGVSGHRSRGRLVIEDHDGQLWTTDGTSPPERLAGVTKPITVAFVDARRGAAVETGGGLAITNDGGRTWDRRDLGSDAAFAVGLAPSGLVADLASGHTLALFDAPHTGLPRNALTQDESVAIEAARTSIVHGHFRVAPRIAACPSQGPAPAPPDVADPLGALAVPQRSRYDAARRAWEPPGFSIVGPQYDAERPWESGTWPVAHVTGHTRLGARHELASRSDHDALPIALHALGEDDASPVQLSWRGVTDDRVEYTSRARVTGALATDLRRAWEYGSGGGDGLFVGMTRSGLLVSTSSSVLTGGEAAPGPTRRRRPRLPSPADSNAGADSALVWITEGGVTSVARNAIGFGRAYSVPRDDGGAAVVARNGDLAALDRPVVLVRSEQLTLSLGTRLTPASAQVFTVIVISPTGVVETRRAWAWRDSVDVFFALAETPAGWALATASSDEPSGLVAHLVTTGETRPVPLASSAAANPCTTHEPSATRLHMFPVATDVPISIGPGFDSPEFADARRVTFDLRGERVCIARVDGVGYGYDYGVSDEPAPPRAVHLFPDGARAFSGTADSGETTWSVHGLLRTYSAGSPE